MIEIFENDIIRGKNMDHFDENQPSYKELRNIISEKTKSVVAWTGAGLSVPAGLPTWEELRDELVSVYGRKSASMEKEAKNKAEGIINVVEGEDDLWRSFRLLKENMGKETYRQTIRRELSVADSVNPPKNYEKLWRIGLSGLINMNIDRLATRAYVQETGREPLEYNSTNIKNCIKTLKNPNPFILNLHGEINDHSSWVFTKDAINWMYDKDVYKKFIDSILINRVVVFVGVTATDRAVGGHLQRISDNFDIGGHFWITSRSDSKTDEWAENVGLRIVRYKSPEGNHKGLKKIFEDLTNYTPEESDPVPVEPNIEEDLSGEEDIDPNKLAKKDPEEIRRVLNKRAKRILSKNGRDKYEEYNQFCEKYDRCIYNAWYTSENDPDNCLMGYEINNEVGKGAFGVVYNAQDKDGKTYAIKKLKQEVRSQDVMLQGFRRGASAHEILSESNVDGIVDYHEAYEIPAFVVMEWVNGPTLKEAVENRQITDWWEILIIAKRISDILRSAHALPQRVLHRDLRPGNVMLRDYYQNPEDLNVVVLDFDLSWHKGAVEESIKEGHAYAGYLAPEQISRNSKYSTRHASVDSYGVGMTMYYMLTGRDPSPVENKHSDWKDNLIKHAQNKRSKRWKSLPKRFARLIYKCTKQDQPERWDMTQIYNEIDRLMDAVEYKKRYVHTELVAEEMAERCGEYPYTWNDENMSAVIKLPNGVDLDIISHEVNSVIEIAIRWTSSGYEDRKNIHKYITSHLDKINAIMKAKNWKILESSFGDKSLLFKASKETSNIIDNIDKNVSAIRNCIDLIEFR